MLFPLKRVRCIRDPSSNIMKDFRGRSKTQCSKLKFSSESGRTGPVWEGLKGGGRTFSLDVDASLWPFPGLDCIAFCTGDSR